MDPCTSPLSASTVSDPEKTPRTAANNLPLNGAANANRIYHPQMNGNNVALPSLININYAYAQTPSVSLDDSISCIMQQQQQQQQQHNVDVHLYITDDLENGRKRHMEYLQLISFAEE